MTTKDSFTRIPLNDLIKIPIKDGLYEVVINHWWALDENENVLIFRKMSLQCNAKESISKRVMGGKTHPGVEVVMLLALAFVHFNSNIGIHQINELLNTVGRSLDTTRKGSY